MTSNKSVYPRQSGFILLSVVLTFTILATLSYMLSRQSAINAGGVVREHQPDVTRYVAEAGYNHAVWQLNRLNCSGYADVAATSLGQHSYTATITDSTGGTLTAGSPANISATGAHANGTSYTFDRNGVKIYQFPVQQLVLQPDAADSKDSYLYEWKKTWNYGTSTTLWVRNNWANSLAYSLISFDVSNIPSEAKIVSAVLELWQNTPSSNGGTVGVRRILSDWVEGTASGANGVANWNDRETGVAWTTPGGDFASAVDASTNIPAATLGWYQWDITPLISDWVSGAQVNRGFTLIPESVNTYVEFNSSDNTNATLRPKLTITYTCECGVVCTPPSPISCNADYIPNKKLLEFNWDGGASNIWDLDYLPEGTVINATTIPAGGGWILIDLGNKHFYVTDAAGSALVDFPTPNDSPVGVSLIRTGSWNNHLAVSDPGNQLIYLIDLNGTIQGSFSTSSITENPLGLAFIETTASGTYDGSLMITSDKDNSGLSIGSVYIVDQSGVFQTSINVNALTAEPYAVSHLPGTDKLLVVAKTNEVFIIDFDGTLYHQYDSSIFGLGTLQGAAIDPLSCNHVIVSKDSTTVGVLNFSNSLTLSASADTTIYENSSGTNYGSNIQFNTGEDNSGPGRKYRSLVQFDISTIPAGATVTSATLRLYQESSVGTGSVSMDAHQVTSTWVENSITWSSSGGGSYDATDLAVASVTLGTTGWIEWSLPTGLIHEWIDAVSPNYGILLNYNGTKNKRADFVSREHGTGTQHPQLVIEYTTP